LLKIGLGSWSDAEEFPTVLLDANIGGGNMGRCMDALLAFEAGAGPVKGAATEP
jgi:hypothetical protein